MKKLLIAAIAVLFTSSLQAQSCIKTSHDVLQNSTKPVMW